MVTKIWLQSILYLFLGSFLFINTSSAQEESPYEVSWKKDGLVLGGMLAAEVGGIAIAVNIKPLSLDLINQLDPRDISSFDRGAIFNDSKKAKNISDIILLSSCVFPFITLADKRVRSEYQKVVAMGMETIILTSSITLYSKIVTKRARPFVYNPAIDLERKQQINARLSFFSGHTSVVSGASFFGAKVYSDYFPDSKWKPVVWTAAVGTSVFTGLMRVKGGKHFPTDVITGYAVGAVVGILIPYFHRSNKTGNKKVKISMISKGNQVGLVLQW